MVAMSRLDIVSRPLYSALSNSKDCILCYIWQEDEKKTIGRYLSGEIVMNPSIRQQVIDARGFCNLHTYQLHKAAFSGQTEDGLGLVMYMHDVLADIKSALEVKPQRLRKRRIAAYLKDLEEPLISKGECAVCTHLLEYDKINSQTLLKLLDSNQDFGNQFMKTKGLCIGHIRSTINSIGSVKVKDVNRTVEVLLQPSKEFIKESSFLLSEYIRKSKWEFRGESKKKEAEAIPDAVKFLSGTIGLFYRLRLSST